MGGATIIVEIACANSNHREMIRKLEMAAKEVSNKIGYTIDHLKATASKLSTKIAPAANEASLKFKKITHDIWTNTVKLHASSINELKGFTLK